MKKQFVKRSIYSSYDWHDMATEEIQVEENGGYDITDPSNLIAIEIYESIKEMTDSTIYTVENILQIIKDGKPISIATNVEEEIQVGEREVTVNPSKFNIVFEDSSHIIVENIFSCGYTCNIHYYIEEFEECDIQYLVAEHIINPGKGCDLITRVYHEPFLSLDDAKVYQEEMMKNYVPGLGRTNSGYKIEICDSKRLISSSWYQKNMSFVQLATKMSLSQEDLENYRYMSGFDALQKLQVEYYNNLSECDRRNVDIVAYHRIESYVPDDYRIKCAEAILKNKFTREMCDKALVLTFVNAKSQQEYDLIRKSLDEYESRITELTYQIAKEHRGHGFTVVSKSGDIRFYKNGYGISFWEYSNVPENKYYGKFQYNFGLILGCFKEYNPDIFVDTFPSEEYVNEWEEAYNKEKYIF